MTLKNMIRCGGCESRASITVLVGIDLDVGTGTVFALLGPAGVGKTTMVNILSG